MKIVTNYPLNEAEERVIYLGLLVVLKQIEKARKNPLVAEVLLHEYKPVGITTLDQLQAFTNDLKAKFEAKSNPSWS